MDFLVVAGSRVGSRSLADDTHGDEELAPLLGQVRSDRLSSGMKLAVVGLPGGAGRCRSKDQALGGCRPVALQ